MSDPYQNKPRTLSEPNEWHEMTFQISIDQSINWDNVDLRRWAHSVAKYTSLMLAKSDNPDLESEDAIETIKTLIMGIRVDRVSLVNDESLYRMIDEFEDE